jgi:glycosyltransferase involved in cell wall biosynthesis
LTKRTILLIGNLGPRSGIGQYTNSLYNQLKLHENKDMMFRSVSFYSPNIERLFFGLAEAGLSPIIPFQSGLSVLSHIARLVNLRGRFALFHVTDGTLGIVARFRRPSVVTVHDVIPFLNFRRRASVITGLVSKVSMENIVYADAIIVNSDHAKREMSKIPKVDHSRISIIHMGVDHELFRPIGKTRSRIHLGLPSGKKILLNVGSEEPRKNIPTLIRAFSRVASHIPDAVLIRVGARESREVAVALSSNGLSDKVDYFKLSQRDLPYLYSASDALIHPSWYEGFGFPLLEAMACGCPVIASDSTSIPEVVGKAGILLNPGDYSTLANAIEDLLNDPDLQMDLAKRGLEQSEKFSWAKTASKTLEVYRDVLSRRG